MKVIVHIKVNASFESGFADVSVTGSGRTRIATGLWARDTVSGAIPNEISDIALMA